MNRCINCNHHEVSHRPHSACVGRYDNGFGAPTTRCECQAFVEATDAEQAALNAAEWLMSAEIPAP